VPTPPLSQALCDEALAAVDQHGGVTAAADALDINRKTFQSRVSEARRRKAGMVVTGRSTLTDLRTGEPVMEWVKETQDRQASLDALRAAAEALAADIPRAEPVAAPRSYADSLCNLYSYFDYHVGMLAWRKEGGDDWDLTIAERSLQQSYGAMVTQAPAARKAIICIGGDWLHTDGLLPLTPASKHVLDADGRFSKIVQVAIRGIRFIVTCALAKHAEVELIVMEGNHDETGSVWLRHMLSALYENEPRLSVNASELPFYVSRWGEVMLGFHHGHKVKNEQLPLLFAAQFPKMWGDTTKRQIHCGHRHHVDEKEYNGVTIIQHPTLSARDAYAARGGWIAERAVQAITYHKRFGQVGRVYVCPEMLRAA
jgi:hypothetical protein